MEFTLREVRTFSLNAYDLENLKTFNISLHINEKEMEKFTANF